MNIKDKEIVVGLQEARDAKVSVEVIKDFVIAMPDNIEKSVIKANELMFAKMETAIIKAIIANNNEIDEKQFKPIKRAVGLLVLLAVALGGTEAIKYFV
jgi:hypothetical protein